MGLNGDKVWELGPVSSPLRQPAFSNAWLRRLLGEDWLPVFGVGDGFYRSGDWRPVFRTTVSAGEALLFPTQMIHRTYAAPAPGSSDGADAGAGDGDGDGAGADAGAGSAACTDSMTMQFDYPLPSAYLRAYWPRLFMAPSARGCVPAWQKALSLDPGFISDHARDRCGRYCLHEAAYDASLRRRGTSYRAAREEDTRLSEAHLGRVLKSRGNATHFSLLEDLYPDEYARRLARLAREHPGPCPDGSNYTFSGGCVDDAAAGEARLLVALDAAHALTSIGAPARPGGEGADAVPLDAAAEKEDLQRLAARLDGARERFSAHLALFQRRDAAARLVWLPLAGMCFAERVAVDPLLRLRRALAGGGGGARAGGLTDTVLGAAYHHLDNGAALPELSGPACRAFFSLDAWLISGQRRYLCLLLLYSAALAGIAWLAWRSRRTACAALRLPTRRSAAAAKGGTMAAAPVRGGPAARQQHASLRGRR